MGKSLETIKQESNPLLEIPLKIKTLCVEICHMKNGNLQMGKIYQAFDLSYLPISASSMFEVRNTDILLKF